MDSIGRVCAIEPSCRPSSRKSAVQWTRPISTSTHPTWTACHPMTCLAGTPTSKSTLCHYLFNFYSFLSFFLSFLGLHPLYFNRLHRLSNNIQTVAFFPPIPFYVLFIGQFSNVQEVDVDERIGFPFLFFCFFLFWPSLLHIDFQTN